MASNRDARWLAGGRARQPARLCARLGGPALGLRLSHQALCQRAATYVFEHEIVDRRGLAGLIDLDDVRMLEPRDQLGLDPKPLIETARTNAARRHDFYRDDGGSA